MHSHKPGQEPRLQLCITNVDYKRKDPVFWIDSSTNLTKYKQKKGRFPRYYSELEKLHRYLAATVDDAFIPHLPGCPTPRFNKDGTLVLRQWWLSISISMNGAKPVGHRDGDTRDGRASVEFRIQRWLDRVTEHDRVRPSEAVREFVESEATMFRPDLKKPRKRLPNKMYVERATENDMEPEFAQWSDTLRLLHRCFEQMPSLVGVLVQRHAEMALAWDRWTASWVAYGGMERQPELFILFKNIARGSQQLQDLERSQGIATAETLGEEISYQVINNQAAQTAMLRRLDALSDYLSSGKYTETCLRNVERLKTSASIDRSRASDAITDLENARLVERDCHQRYDRVDSNLRRDLQIGYKADLAKDMLDAIRDYAKSQLHLEKQKLLVWQAIAIQNGQ